MQVKEIDKVIIKLIQFYIQLKNVLLNYTIYIIDIMNVSSLEFMLNFYELEYQIQVNMPYFKALKIINYFFTIHMIRVFNSLQNIFNKLQFIIMQLVVTN